MSESNTHAPAGGLRLLGYLVLAALSLVGLKAIIGTLADGHGALATTQHVPWGLWVALYIFFLGLSAGSFLLSTLIYVFGMKSLKPVGPLALLQALGCLLLGGLLIILDLGHPARLANVILHMNPTSAMAWMGIFYNLYILVVLVELYLAMRPRLIELASAGGAMSRWYCLLTLGSSNTSAAALARDQGWLKALGILGIPVAIAVHGGVGAIFAVTKARALWYSGLFPIIFLISALASGGALLTFLSVVTLKVPEEQKRKIVRLLARLTTGILCFDLLLLASEILVVFYGGLPHHADGWRQVLFGPYSWVFWGLQLALGTLLPILIVGGRRTGQSMKWLGFAGLLGVLGIIGARLNIVIPAQITPMFPTLPEAYHHMRYAYGYFPNSTEWQVGLGVCALGWLAFVLVRKCLPLDGQEHSATASSGGGEA
ncbi:MAG: polysulfide reductase NrfD [Planctomycetes bacterium]|nr:polysulfide reductase NrfD [Planctomycetota bacterium]